MNSTPPKSYIYVYMDKEILEDAGSNLVYLFIKSPTAPLWKKKEEKEQVEVDSSTIKLRLIVNFISVAFRGRYHDQTPATQRKCKRSERPCIFKQGQDLSQRFQSALELSQPAGTDLWNCSIIGKTWISAIQPSCFFEPRRFTVRSVSDFIQSVCFSHLWLKINS